MGTEVLFEPSPKQMEFLEAVFSEEFLYILFGGAIRGGKTFAGLGALLMLCKAYPGSRWAVVRDTLPTLKRNTIPSFNKICPTRYRKSYNQDTQTVTFNNGSQIIFFAENYDDDKELNRWKGLEVNGFLLEEVNELQEVSFDKAIERAGSFIPPKGKKPPPLILMTCNPAQNWVKTKFYKPWKEGVLIAPYKYIPSKITDNPFIMNDPVYVNQLKNMTKYNYMVFVEGNWDVSLKVGGEFYKCFELDKHIGPAVYDPSLSLHISWDDNVNPYIPTGIFQIATKDNIREVRMIDEVVGKTPLNNVENNCREIIRRFPSHTSGMFVYGDATANKEDTKLEKGMNFYRLVLKYLDQYRPTSRVMQSNPSVVMRKNWINTVLEKELGEIKVIIDPKCEETINDFVGLKEAAGGEKLKEYTTDPKTRVKYQKFGHFTDLFDYFVCSAFQTDFMKYQKGGTTPKPSFGQNKSNNSY